MTVLIRLLDDYCLRIWYRSMVAAAPITVPSAPCFSTRITFPLHSTRRGLPFVISGGKVRTNCKDDPTLTGVPNSRYTPLELMSLVLNVISSPRNSFSIRVPGNVIANRCADLLSAVSVIPAFLMLCPVHGFINTNFIATSFTLPVAKTVYAPRFTFSTEMPVRGRAAYHLVHSHGGKLGAP